MGKDYCSRGLLTPPIVLAPTVLKLITPLLDGISDGYPLTILFLLKLDYSLTGNFIICFSMGRTSPLTLTLPILM